MYTTVIEYITLDYNDGTDNRLQYMLHLTIISGQNKALDSLRLGGGNQNVNILKEQIFHVN